MHEGGYINYAVSQTTSINVVYDKQVFFDASEP